jgi:predicted transcriptional regulator YdeE
MEYYIQDYGVRHYAGIMAEGGISLINISERQKIKETWRFFYEYILEALPERVSPQYYIGLDWYGDDYQERRAYDYMVLAQVKEEFEDYGNIIYRTLPEGKYVVFPMIYDYIRIMKQKAYILIKKHKINVDYTFEFIEYLPDQNYMDPEAIVNFCMKIVDVH